MPAEKSEKFKLFLEQGLNSREVSAARDKYGPNEIERKRQFSGLKILWSQFKSPLIYILVLAGVVTLVLEEYVDSSVIWAAVIVNSMLGFWQEFKAVKSLQALASYLKPQARVIRDGEVEQIAVAEVVVGDVVVLGAGESAAADGMVVKSNNLTLNEAILTGESVPVVKKVKGQVFMGTMVEVGTGKFVVTKVGKNTQMGKIAGSLSETQEGPTPLQQQIIKLSKTLATVVFAVTFLIAILGMYRGYGPVEMFETAVAVAVGAIPEGLVVGVTVILALGMQRILKRRALVRKLVAAETLGGVRVICTDKTGTLTEGKMTVVDALGNNLSLLARAAAISNDRRDPLEIAMYSWARKKIKHLGGQVRRLAELPFNSERKFRATLAEVNGKRQFFVTGAPEVVLSKCQMPNAKLKMWNERFVYLGAKGLRLVGLAQKSLKHENIKTREHKRLRVGDVSNLQWLGVVVFEDRLRKGVTESLKQARKAGIDIKVISGDFRETTVAVYDKLKIQNSKLKAEEIMDGEELKRMSRKELERRVASIKLFVRTSPDQKLKIVEALQARGESVAMTGDGVNDSPAIKKADIGIVVNEAADVSKETADMVLIDSNFGTIVAAVREGRIIYETIKKMIVYLLSGSFTEIILVTGSLLMALPLPITAAQILWINLIEDSLPSLALAFEHNEPGLMKEKPRKRSAPLIDREMKIIIFVIGIVTDLLLFGLFWALYRQELPMVQVRTFVFVGLGIDSLLYVFSVKNFRINIWEENLTDNVFLLVAVGIGFLLLVPAVYWSPLQNLLGVQALLPWVWGLLLGLGLIKVAAIEAVKYAFLRKSKKV